MRQTAEKILGRKLMPEEGIAESQLRDAEQRLDIQLPVPLRDFYQHVGNLPLFTSGFQQFAAPHELYMSGRKLVFLDENQGVVSWSIDLDNQSIYQSGNVEGEPEWHSEELSAEDFIRLILYYQCVMADSSIQAATPGGFEFGASLIHEELEINEAAQQFFASLPNNWEKVADHNHLLIFWQPSQLVSYFTDDDGEAAELILYTTQHKNLLDEMINRYGFDEV
ncbi:MAG TPA: SMI1/KNR4 family protein [Chitinophaga sp.]|uniref:SMI1/KNR4 family protein n=1 Tax=Chitinophaga sp. TaxID=1869181 RepID=UPI002CF85302|nr:SMI1/KNR4 family protein [Chitinophaga sp.]HVI47650.1 SMI1/KNR4 family protein [Chitinophaga sp.]